MLSFRSFLHFFQPYVTCVHFSPFSHNHGLVKNHPKWKETKIGGIHFPLDHDYGRNGIFQQFEAKKEETAAVGKSQRGRWGIFVTSQVESLRWFYWFIIVNSSPSMYRCVLFRDLRIFIQKWCFMTLFQTPRYQASFFWLSNPEVEMVQA